MRAQKERRLHSDTRHAMTNNSIEGRKTEKGSPTKAAK
jgi:hypothetical protein